MTDQEKQLQHDINSSLSALLSALELIREEWKTNQVLVEKMLPLTSAKLSELQEGLTSYYDNR